MDSQFVPVQNGPDFGRNPLRPTSPYVMTLNEAARLLELPPDATPVQIELRFLSLRNRVHEKIDAEPAEYFKDRHRATLTQYAAAYELLKLSAEMYTPNPLASAGIPSATAPAAPAAPKTTAAPKPTPSPLQTPAPKGTVASSPTPPTPAATPSPPTAAAPPPAAKTPTPAKPGPATAASTQPVSAPPPASGELNRGALNPRAEPDAEDNSGGSGRLLVVGLAVLVLVGGGWGYSRFRASATQRGEIKSALVVRRASAQERWQRLVKEVASAESQQAKLGVDAQAADLAGPALAELQARAEAQAAFVAWARPFVDGGAPKALLADLDRLLAASAFAEAAPVEEKLRASIDQAEKEFGIAKVRLLALGEPAELVSQPPGLTFTLLDAYGRTSEGVTPARVEVPWGRLKITVATPGAEWPEFQRELDVTRDTPVAVNAVFAYGPVQLNSIPSGLTYELVRPTGLALKGITPATLENVPTGSATLRVLRPDWPVQEQVVEIAPEANNFEVEFAAGAFTLTTEPAGATVSENGKALGTTPLTLTDLAPGKRSYAVKLKGHRLVSVNAQVRARETTVSALKLEAVPDLEKGKPYVVPFLGMELVSIPGGLFTMGSVNAEPGRGADETLHEVLISRGFWLGKFEVTRTEWRVVMEDSPIPAKADRLPVVQVSWEDAVTFCRKLTAREHAAERLPAGYEYTLPTEAQWEYACRANTEGLYGVEGDLGTVAWYRSSSAAKVHEVGQKKANTWGLHDMHGNVGEWCADWFGYLQESKVIDPSGPADGTRRVSRGGDWGSDAASCRSASRLSYAPEERAPHLGFRLALSPVKRGGD